MLEIINKSPDRVDYKDVSLQSVMSFGPISYEGTLKRKQQMIAHALKKAGIENYNLKPIEKLIFQSHPAIRAFVTLQNRITEL